MTRRPQIPTWAFKLAAGVAMLAIIFMQLPLADLRDSLRSVAFPALAVGILFGFVTRYIAAARMSLIMRKLDFSGTVFGIFGISLKSSYFSFFLPGTIAGGAARWYLLKRSGSSGADAFVGIFFDRVIEISTLVAIGFAASLLTADVPGAAALQIVFAMLFVVILVTQFAMFNAYFLEFMRRVVSWLRLDRWALFTRIFDAVAESSSAFHELPARWQGRVWILSLTSHAFGIVAYYVLSRAAGLELALFDLAWIRAAVSIINLLPLTFAGLGVREGLLIVLLAGYGVSAVDAVTFSLVLFLQLVTMSATGGILIALDLLRKRQARAAIDPGQPS